MMYEYRGKKYTKAQVIDRIGLSSGTGVADLIDMQVQQRVNAERRTEMETDPVRRRRMELLISEGVYDFDKIFGP